jgi:hypothetical protein
MIPSVHSPQSETHRQKGLLFILWSNLRFDDRSDYLLSWIKP